MGLHAGLQIIGKAVANYTDDAARLVAKNGDDVARAISFTSDDVARYAKACGKRSILETKPLQVKINPKDLGVCFPDGTINFSTQKSAIKYMQKNLFKIAVWM